MTVTSIITESERISKENDSAAADNALAFRPLTRQMVAPLVSSRTVIMELRHSDMWLCEI